jgi:ceramide glucosyltransferase
MAGALSVMLFALATVGLAAAVVQALALRAHLRGKDPAPRPASAPSASILKPLCGVDDDLEANLASFAALDYPRYEVLLGVRSRQDAAHAVARAVAARWPARFRVVIQRGEPGANPKVNQLVTLAAEARGALVVVSDSNVRVHSAYLSEIAALLEDPAVGLVTHPIAGVGEERLGSLLDNLHLAGAIAPGVVAAQRLAGRAVVVGKSMAFRSGDLAALGGFSAVKDVLAEDYVLGLLVGSRLGKRVAIARRPVENVSQRRGLGHFLSRYARWAVLQRQAVGPAVYIAQALLNPVLLAGCAFAAAPGVESLAALAGTCGAKMAVDGVAASRLRRGGFRVRQLAAIPAKDLLFGVAWAYGLVRDEVSWRGNRLRVLPGTRIAAPPAAAPEPGAIETAAHS